MMMLIASPTATSCDVYYAVSIVNDASYLVLCTCSCIYSITCCQMSVYLCVYYLAQVSVCLSVCLMFASADQNVVINMADVS